MNLPSLPQVDPPEFPGPLDLLVDEVRRQNVAIEHIAMAPLVARFLAYVQGAPAQRLDLDIEWLHLAATLIHWKSRSLLPRAPEEKEAPRDPVRDELVDLLRRHHQEAAARLAEEKRIEDSRLSRPLEPPVSEDSPGGDDEGVPFVSVWDLIGQARDLASWVRAHRQTEQHWHNTFDLAPEVVTVAQMSDQLRHLLGSATSLPLDALPLVLGQPTPAHRCCLFLALLEMVRDQEITVRQAPNTWRSGAEITTDKGIWIAAKPSHENSTSPLNGD